MRLVINNRDTDLAGSQLTVRQMLQQMKFTFPMIFVRVNGEVIRKDQYDSFVIRIASFQGRPPVAGGNRTGRPFFSRHSQTSMTEMLAAST